MAVAAAIAAAAASGACFYLWQPFRGSAAYCALVSRIAMPALQLLDPETAHNLAVASAALRLTPIDGEAEDALLAVSLWGLRFANPIGLAAGFDKQVRCEQSALRGRHRAAAASGRALGQRVAAPLFCR